MPPMATAILQDTDVQWRSACKCDEETTCTLVTVQVLGTDDAEASA